MLNRGSQVIGIILIILIFLSTVGCLFDDESKPDDKRKGFDADDLSSTVPQVLDLNDQLIEPKPIINTSIRKSASNVVAIWYFEKNTVYQDYGGVITFSIKNERASEIYIYQIGIELGWQPFKSSNDDRGVSTKVGKYIDLGTEEYVGMLYFPGPKNTGEYEYHINFLYVS